MNPTKDNMNKYPFVHAHIAKEPFIFDVLDEIARNQKEVLRGETGRLATLEILKESRSIKMPTTHVRGKNIAYILDTLSNTYPDDVQRLYSFKFLADPESKKLSIDETVEYTVLCGSTDMIRLQEERDEGSLSSFHELLEKFRLFNLTKLLHKAKNRAHLSKIIKSDLGVNLFTFKHFSLDKNNLEVAEDYCFHRTNYESVKKSINTEIIKKILKDYNTQVSRRLQKFGILNSDFSDYRESKVDYLINILLEDISTSMAQKDLIEVKNFSSLRGCLAKVEKIIDPLITLGNDIVKHVRENGITRRRDLITLFNGFTEEMFDKWSRDSALKSRILIHKDDTDTYCIDGMSFLQSISDCHKRILLSQDAFAKLNHFEKQTTLDTFEMLCDTGRELINAPSLADTVLPAGDSIDKLIKIIKDFDDYKKRLSVQENIEKDLVTQKGNRSIFNVIIDFFKSLFSGSPKDTRKKPQEASPTGVIKRTMTKESQDIMQKIRSTSALILPLSNFLTLSDENHYMIDSIIDELRNTNTKTVIPVYNARKILYPQRSKKLLLSDTEYLMVDPDLIQSPDIIRSFTDSLASEKIKDETITPSAIIHVEKYLLTLYRQKRAQMKRKDTKQEG
jgi:hypothetical protein